MLWQELLLKNNARNNEDDIFANSLIAKEAYFKYNQAMKELVPIFEKYPQIKLVYFFGSRAKKEAGPLSDYDFAFYATEKNKMKLFDLKLSLQEKLSTLLKTDAVDVVSLNSAKSPELKYNIIREGKIIYEKEPYRLILEPKILNEYFDFRQELLRHGLTAKES